MNGQKFFVEITPRPAIIKKIQKSLKTNGYAPGRTDGQLDQKQWMH